MKDAVQCTECLRKTQPVPKTNMTKIGFTKVEYYCNGKWTPTMIGHKLTRMVQV